MISVCILLSPFYTLNICLYKEQFVLNMQNSNYCQKSRAVYEFLKPQAPQTW